MDIGFRMPAQHTMARLHAMNRRRLCVGMFAATQSVSALEFQHEVEQNLRLRMAVMSVIPLGMVDAAGRPFGIYADIGVAVAQRTGIAIDLTVAPLPRAIALLGTGQIDIMIATQSRAIEDAALALSPITEVDIVVAGLKGTRISSLADLQGKTVGQQRGAEYDEQFSSDRRIKKYDVTDTAQLVRMLFARRIDAVIANRYTLLYALKSMKISSEALGQFMLVSRRQSWLWYSKRTYQPHLGGLLKQAVGQLSHTGGINEIRQRYLQGL